MGTNSMNAAEYFKSIRKGKELTLCGLLRSLRLCDEISQTEFAKKLGISKQHLCDIEKKRKHVSPARAVKFAKKLGYDEMLFVTLALQDILESEKLKMRVSVAAA